MGAVGRLQAAGGLGRPATRMLRHGQQQDKTDPPIDLQEEMKKRKAWFFETQLRRFNYDSFPRVSEQPLHQTICWI